MSKEFRKENDILGEINVPSDVYWGINTQRAIQNFQISDKPLPATEPIPGFPDWFPSSIPCVPIIADNLICFVF